MESSFVNPEFRSDPENQKRTIYLLEYIDELGRSKKSWHASKQQAELVARDMKRPFTIKAARI